MDSRIYSVIAREIIDSRGNPTLETTVILNSGYRGTAAVPAGASIGTFEASELRDKDPKRYHGMGVSTAIANVNSVISPKLVGVDAFNQQLIDKQMIDMDGTPTKSHLGANAMLGVSLAVAVAAASHKRIALYTYLNQLFQTWLPTPITRIPTPTFNLINGGKHGGGNLDFQEFHIVPATSKRFSEALQIGCELYFALKEMLIYRNLVHSVGDEGGFGPNLYTNLDAMEILMELVRESPYRFGVDVFFGMDIAANSFKTPRGYQIKDKSIALQRDDFIKYLHELHSKYRLLLLEDPLEENDWEGWAKITRELGSEVFIIGDDFIVTNLERLTRAVAEKACSAVIIKPNQAGTLTETLEVIAFAKKNDIKCIVSHRSGETNDTFISDLAVAVQSEYVKFGAPARGERVAKYNRLLQIEKELGK